MIIEDFRYVFRSLYKNPGYTAAMVGVLALGVGLNTAVFWVTDAVLLRPLPFQEPQRLVQVWAVRGDTMVPNFAPGQARFWLENADFFQEAALYDQVNVVRTDHREAETMHVLGTSPGLLEALGADPLYGRGFTPEDARPGAAPAVVLSHRYWRSRLGGDEEALGRELTLDEKPYTIIGILPKGVVFPWRSAVQAWIPLVDNRLIAGRAAKSLSIVGRLKQGISHPQAQERAEALFSGLGEEPGVAQAILDGSAERGGWSPRLLPVGNFRADNQLRMALWTLLGASALILLIALFNAANLMLVRQAGRRRELGIRVAVGASRRRLLQLLSAEALVVSLLAAAGATALAFAGTRFILAMAPSDLTKFNQLLLPQLDLRVVAYAGLVSMLSGLLIGTAVALKGAASSRTVHSSSLRGGEADPRWRRTRSALVVAEVALSLALLAGAGLMLRSFWALLDTDLGWNPNGLVRLSLSLSEHHFAESAPREALYRELVERLTSLPGVEQVALSSGTHLSFASSLEAEGRPAPDNEGVLFVPWKYVEPGFFETMQAGLVAGRDFDSREDAGRGAAVIDQGLARHLWGQESPLGRRFRLGPEQEWLTVVGVVEDFKLMGPDDRRGPFEFFRLRDPAKASLYESFAIRSRGEAGPLISQIRGIVREVAPGQPIRNLHEAWVGLEETWAEERFYLLLMSAFAATALVLAVLGIYGVLAYSQRFRRTEMGVRMAVGARPRDVRRLVLGSGLRLAAAGTALGLLLSLGLGGLMRNLLFGVQPDDPLTLASTAALMFAAAAAAGWIPAWRATRVDPVEVLRAQ